MRRRFDAGSGGKMLEKAHETCVLTTQPLLGHSRQAWKAKPAAPPLIASRERFPTVLVFWEQHR
jgi:hypothetical protein